jgi:hypothetical protein
MTLRSEQRARRWALREMARLDARRDSLRDHDGGAPDADGRGSGPRAGGRRPPRPGEAGRG